MNKNIKKSSFEMNEHELDKERFLKTLVHYADFDRVLDAIEEVHRSHLSSRAKSLIITGLSGLGKSTAMNFHQEKYPDRENGDVIPILRINLHSVPTDKGIVDAILCKIDPYASNKSHLNSLHMKNRLLKLLDQYSVEMIVIDEIQHILPGHNERKRMQHFIDSLKHLIDETGLPFILIGQPSASDILSFEDPGSGEENQLRQRFRNTIELSSIPYESHAWKKVINAYRSELSMDSIDFTEGELGLRFHAASKGRHSNTIDILTGAMKQWPGKGILNTDHLILGYKNNVVSDPNMVNPFNCTLGQLDAFIKNTESGDRIKLERNSRKRRAKL